MCSLVGKKKDNFEFEKYDPEKGWTGNLVGLNGSNVDVIKSKTIDATSVNHLYLPNLVELDLQRSNLKQVARILESELQNLESLNLSKCRGMVSSDFNWSNSFTKLSNTDERFFIFCKLIQRPYF